jgi:hypothetical protein
MKKCRKCLDIKEENDYYKGNAICKKCKIDYQKKHSELNKDKVKEYKRNYTIINKISISEKNKERYEENIDFIKEKSKAYYENNKKVKLIYQKKYAEENKEKISEYKRKYQNDRRKNDPVFRLKFSVSRMIRNSLKNNVFVKNERTKIILGIPIEEFKIYLESKFIDDMSWENYGVFWDIDHIVPLSTAITEEDVLRLNHYSNLQPLDSYVNRNIKRDRLEFYK